jgi:hypothetical protein
MKSNEAHHLIGCCGIYCGLCNKYQSKAPSRCIGCQLGEQHSWCSIWNCCVKKHGFSNCTECSELFKCAIFSKRKVAEWIPAAENLHRIKEIGLGNWLKGQKERLRLVEELLQNYNDGRLTSLSCRVCAKMPIELISRALKESKKKIVNGKLDASDVKSKAKIIKAILEDLAFKAHINLD